MFLYDGYDWARTRKTIEQEVKEMRKRLAKIRQLVANGQTQETDSDDVSAVLFNSVHIGLDEDFDLTPSLARFLAMNEDKIGLRLRELESTIEQYRQHARAECRWKEEVLTYRFLAFVYDRPQDPSRLAESSILHERDLRVRQLMAGSEGVFETAYERLEVVTSSEAACWWYIFWVRI